jgi:two-component system NtrC family sensor kinase
MLGYSLEEVRELHTWDWDKNFPPEEILEMGRNVDEKGLHLATKHTRKDGSVIDVDISISAAMCSGQKLIFCVCRDITDRKQAEEALRQSEEKYRTILEEMSDAYFEVDLGGHLTFANNSLYHDLGYSIEELRGMSYKDFTSDDDIEPVFRVFNEVYQTGVANKGFSWKTTRKDGSHGFAETSVSPIRDDEGKIIGFRGVGRDITERKQAEEALRQSEENYRALFDSSVIGTIVLDADTVRVAMANRAATEIFGFSSVEEVQGLDPLDYIRPEDKDRVVELALSNLLEQDSRQVYELGAFTKDGREIWISATGAKIMHEGKLAGLISFTDITEQKKQSEHIILTDRLASLGELASGTAHELNNPLTSIIGFSQLLMEGEVPDDIRDDLKLINYEAQRAASITKNLLTFARKHAPEKQSNQINSIVEDVLKLRAYEHKANSIEVERQFAPDLPEVMVDYFQIQQVFINIIINAEYFMTKEHGKGTLTITTKKNNRTVVISFADDGPGIPREILRRIFDPFFTSKESGKGTGLGLSICHGIVAEHGGQIYARNHQGKGATIVVELPINSH